MRRFAFALMIVALTLALLPGAVLASDCDSGDYDAYPLYAGQNILVGEVRVCNTDTQLQVTYVTDSDWPIAETHLWVGDDWMDAPQKNGNPIPGQFPYKGEHFPAVTTVSYDIPYSAAVGDPVYIAAHAVVWDTTPGASTALLQICSDGDEAYTAYNNLPLGPDAGASDPRSGTAYPSAEPYGEQFDAAPSVWDNGVGFPFGVDDDNVCADWIWEMNLMEATDNGAPMSFLINQVVNPVRGDRVELTETFNVPGPFANGTLWASCDNAYEAYVNTTTPGNPLIWGQLGTDQNVPPYTTGPYPGPGWWSSELKEANVNTEGWQSVESAALAGLVQGPNYLFFRAANEYMYPPDFKNSSPGNTPISAVWDQYVFVPDAYINPAGIIWQADIYYYDSDETAWGAQDAPGTNPFPGKNWATYIEYTWQ